MDKLVFTPKSVNQNENSNHIRITGEAMTHVKMIQRSTGLSLTFIASEMIKFAARHTSVYNTNKVAFHEPSVFEETE